MKALVEVIREKSRQEWEEYFRGSLTNLRIWIQENGEKALIVGLVVGVIITQFFKLFIVLAALAVCGAYFVWLVSLPEGRSGSNDSTFTMPVNGTSEPSQERNSDSKPHSDI